MFACYLLRLVLPKIIELSTKYLKKSEKFHIKKITIILIIEEKRYLNLSKLKLTYSIFTVVVVTRKVAATETRLHQIP